MRERCEFIFVVITSLFDRKNASVADSGSGSVSVDLASKPFDTDENYFFFKPLEYRFYFL